MAHRRRFRDQSLASILIRITRLLLTPTSHVPVAVPDSPLLEADNAPVSPDVRRSGPLVSAIVVLVIVVVVSIVILAHVFSSGGSTAVNLPITASTAQPAVSSNAPFVVPAGTVVHPSQEFGGTPGGPQFLQPQEALPGPGGVIYVADTGNHRVAVLNKQGKLLRAITEGMNGSLQSPFSLALTHNGHLLVLDSDAGLIVEYDAVGHPLRASPKDLSLGHARGIVVDMRGDVLVADPAANSVFTLAPDFTLLHQQPGAVSGKPDLFNQPSAVAAGKDGSIYVVDSQANRIDRFTQDWQLQQTWPVRIGDTVHSPRVLPLSGDRLLVSDPGDAKLLLYDPSGGQPRAFTLTGTTTSPQQPLGIAFAGSSNVVVTLNGSNQVWLVHLPGL